MSEERFNVLLHFPGGSYHVEKRGVPAQEAVETAADFSRRPAAVVGFIASIQITSEDNEDTVFLWEHGKGVVFPPRPEQAP
jgi:hypothetical protein